MHPSTRGERRAASDRRQASRTRFYRRVNAHLAELMPYHCMSGVVPDAEAVSQGMGRKFRDLRQPCSCMFCSRRRSIAGPTLQERRLADAEALDT